jgi:hypothetical protein
MKIAIRKEVNKGLVLIGIKIFDIAVKSANILTDRSKFRMMVSHFFRK